VAQPIARRAALTYLLDLEPRSRHRCHPVPVKSVNGSVKSVIPSRHLPPSATQIENEEARAQCTASSGNRSWQILPHSFRSFPYVLELVPQIVQL